MEGNLILLESLLTEFGYNVVSAINGEDALEKLHTEKDCDLIISDVLMPVMDGFMLCNNVKKDEKLKNIPFVFYTASYVDEKDDELIFSNKKNEVYYPENQCMHYLGRLVKLGSCR